MKIDRDKQALEELRMEVVDREDYLLRREGEASLLEEQVTIREKEALTREVALDLREEMISRGEEDLAARMRWIEEDAERCVEGACKAAAEAVENAKAEARRAVEETEAAKGSHSGLRKIGAAASTKRSRGA